MDKLAKVIKGLECCIKRDSDDKTRCSECPYEGACLNRLKLDALALLKAQEPMAVHVTKEINYRKIGICPNCGKLINSGDYPNYCGHCGQAVKWSE